MAHTAGGDLHLLRPAVVVRPGRGWEQAALRPEGGRRCHEARGLVMLPLCVPSQVTGERFAKLLGAVNDLLVALAEKYALAKVRRLVEGKDPSCAERARATGNLWRPACRDGPRR